jgi:hypothetical protein
VQPPVVHNDRLFRHKGSVRHTGRRSVLMKLPPTGLSGHLVSTRNSLSGTLTQASFQCLHHHLAEFLEAAELSSVNEPL